MSDADTMRAAAEAMRQQADVETFAPWTVDTVRAVADWLDHAAESAGLNRSPYVDEHLTLAVAMAYLGGA